MASAILHDSSQLLQELDDALLSANKHLLRIQEHINYMQTHLQQIVVLGARSKEKILCLEALCSAWKADSNTPA